MFILKIAEGKITSIASSFATLNLKSSTLKVVQDKARTSKERHEIVGDGNKDNAIKEKQQKELSEDDQIHDTQDRKIGRT